MSDKFPVMPLFDRVFVKKDDETKTDSGFYMPDSVKGRAKTGTVVAVGHGWLNPNTGDTIPLKLKIGDRVFLAEFSGSIIDYKGERVWVFRENEIIGIITEE
jgi:chaperonin GroES